MCKIYKVEISHDAIISRVMSFDTANELIKEDDPKRGIKSIELNNARNSFIYTTTLENYKGKLCREVLQHGITIYYM